MARAGRFGRLPRPAPSLTNTLIAIAREMQSQRDQNIMSAWQKGGLFEGHQVTDEMVLAHWAKRMEGVSKDDPLYDTYKMAREQLDYAIHESKMTARYALGKVSDGQMAQFYLGWAKKVPVNSEFYRALQRDAGQFLKAAKARSQADIRRAAELAYQKRMVDLHAKNEKAGEFLVDTFRTMAQVGNGGIGVPALIGAPGSGSDLTNFDPTDPSQMLRLVNDIMYRSSSSATEGAVAGNIRVLYHDPVTGAAITGADIVKRLKAMDPTFDGNLDISYVKNLLRRQIDGLGERIDYATKTGHVSDASQLARQREYFAATARQMNAWPVQQDYLVARQDFDRVMNDASASPQARLAAWTKYQGRLFSLAEDDRIATDDVTRNALLAEANGDKSGWSLADSFTQTSSEATGGKGSIGIDQENVRILQEQVDAVAGGAGQVVWTQGMYNADGSFEPRPGAPAIGAAYMQDVEALSLEKPVVVYTPQNGSVAVPLTVALVPITAYGILANGEEVALDNANPALYFAQVNVGGKTVKVYSYKVNGRTMYSTETPWDDSKVVEVPTEAGIALRMTAALPAFDPRVNTDPTAAFYVAGYKAATKTAAETPGRLYMNPALAVIGTDTARAAVGGYVPTQDYFSPTLAALASLPDGQELLRVMMRDPLFVAQVRSEAAVSAGYTFDMMNGAYVPGPDADPYALGAADRALSRQLGQMSTGEKLQAAIVDLYERVKTVAELGSVPRPLVAPGVLGEQAATGQDYKLPSDRLVGTGFDRLGEQFNKGNTTLRDVKFGRPGEIELRTPTVISVPGVPASIAKPAPAPVSVPVTPAPIPVYQPPAPTPVPIYQPPKPFNISEEIFNGRML